MMGRVYTAFNLLGFLTTAVVQWLVGFILDIYPRTALGGAAPEGYRLAFLVLVGCQFLAACWYLLATRANFGSTTMLERFPES